MTYAQALAYIEAWIIDNNNKEITASIMRDVLEKMLLYVNDSVGDVGSLNEGNNVVEAVNILFGMIDNLQVDFPIEVHTGTDNPNINPPVGFSAPDFYIRNGTQTYIYTGMSWVLIQDSSTTGTPSLELVVQEGNTTSRRLIGLDFFENKSDYEFAQIRDLKNAVFEGVNIPEGTLGNIQNLNNTNSYLWSPFILNTHFASKDWVSLQDFITSTNANNLFVKRTFEVEGVGGLQGGGVMNDTRIEISLTTDSVNKLNRGNTAWGWGNHADAGYAMPYTIGTKQLIQTGTSEIEMVWSPKVLAESLVPSGRTINNGWGMIGGGPLTEDLTLGLDSDTIALIREGEEAHSWGDHSLMNYASQQWVLDKNYITAYTKGTVQALTTGSSEIEMVWSPKVLAQGLVPSSYEIYNGWGIIGGGPMTGDITIGIDSDTIAKINKGVDAYNWGNHSDANYTTKQWVLDQNYITAYTIGTKQLIQTGSSEIEMVWSPKVLAESLVPTSRKIENGWGMIGGGPLTEDLTLGLDSDTIALIREGETAFGWGNHADANYVSQQWVLDKNYVTAYSVGSVQALTTGTSEVNMVWSPKVLAQGLVPSSYEIYNGWGIIGGGKMTGDITIGIDSETIALIREGETAHSWGNHSSAGYATQTWVNTNFLKSADIVTYTPGSVNLLNVGSSEIPMVWSPKVLATGLVPSNREIYEGYGITGGGKLSEDLTIGLTQTVIGQLNQAHSHTNKTVLDGITSGLVSNWNTAYNQRHSHSNKAVLDLITSTSINNWNANINQAEGDARYALRTRTITAGTGLTGGGNLTANRTFSFDTDWGDNRYFGSIGGNVLNLDNVPIGTAMRATFAVSTSAGFGSHGSGITLGYNNDLKTQLWINNNGTVQSKSFRDSIVRSMWDDVNLPDPMYNTGVLTNLDTHRISGYGHFNSGAIGSPVPAASSIQYLSLFSNSSHGVMFAGRVAGGGEFFLRSVNAGTIGNWLRIADRDWVNSQSSLQNYYTKNQSNDRFVTLSGVQTINSTKTFTSSPVVPLATLDSHAVNLRQIDGHHQKFLSGTSGIGVQYAKIGRVSEDNSIAFILSGGGSFGSRQRQMGVIQAGVRSGNIFIEFREWFTTDSSSKVEVLYTDVGGGVFDIWISKAIYQRNITIKTMSDGISIPETSLTWTTTKPTGAVTADRNQFWHTGNLERGYANYLVAGTDTMQRIWSAKVLADYMKSITADVVQSTSVTQMPTDYVIPLNNVQGTIYSANARNHNFSVNTQAMELGAWATFKYRTTTNTTLKTITGATQVRGSAPRPNTTYTLFVYCTYGISGTPTKIAEYCYIED